MPVPLSATVPGSGEWHCHGTGTGGPQHSGSHRSGSGSASAVVGTDSLTGNGTGLPLALAVTGTDSVTENSGVCYSLKRDKTIVYAYNICSVAFCVRLSPISRYFVYTQNVRALWWVSKCRLK